MAAVTVVRTWLEMREPPAVSTRPTPPGVTLTHDACTPAAYRALYAAVGRAWHWHERDAWSDERLTAHLANPDVGVWVLRVDGVAAGYFELRRHGDGAVELAYFGLMGAYLGRGLGRWLLEQAVATAWTWTSTRVWLHTCTLDHPAALPNYLARGFRPWYEDRYVVELPDA